MLFAVDSWYDPYYSAMFFAAILVGLWKGIQSVRDNPR